MTLKGLRFPEPGMDCYALSWPVRRGDEHLTAYRLEQIRLADQARAAGVARAYVVNTTLDTLVDSRSDQPVRSRGRTSEWRSISWDALPTHDGRSSAALP
jgi:hypothetical protein